MFQLFYHVIFESLSHRELISSDDLENSKDKKNLLKQQNSAKTDKTKPHIPKTAEPFEKKRIEQERAGREALTGENQISQIENKKNLTGENEITSVGTDESEPKEVKPLLVREMRIKLYIIKMMFLRIIKICGQKIKVQ